MDEGACKPLDGGGGSVVAEPGAPAALPAGPSPELRIEGGGAEVTGVEGWPLCPGPVAEYGVGGSLGVG